MKYTIAIRLNATGEERLYRDDYDWPSDDGMLFAYTEGNYGCDCNRKLFFERAAGGEPDFDSAECGEAAYSILYAIREDGTRVPVDDEATQ